jgi:hypothetical protein
MFIHYEIALKKLHKLVSDSIIEYRGYLIERYHDKFIVNGQPFDRIDQARHRVDELFPLPEFAI